MYLILIGAVLVAISAAAIFSLGFRLLGRPVPKGILPVVAGVALATFVVWNDYSWFDRTAAELPEQVVILDTYSYSGAWQPWTYLVPRINRFTALNRDAVRRNANLPGMVMADLLLVARYEPVRTATQMIDCAGARRADVTNSTRFGDDGMPENVAWIELEPAHPILQAVCQDAQSPATAS
jgi:hypothetical protein